MAAIGFLVQNCSNGLVLGAIGTVLPTMQAELKVDRGVIASTVGIIYISLCLCSPLVGVLLTRWPLRRVLACGTLLCAGGSAILASADSFLTVALTCALILGPGMCMCGSIPACTLVSRWFDQDRGKALGIVNMPFLYLIVPPAGAALILSGGRALLFEWVAATFLLLLIPLMWVRERVNTGTAGASPASEDQGLPTATPPVVIPLRSLIGDVRFWMLSVGIGLMAGSGTIFVTHAVAIGLDKGFDLAHAALLMSMFGGGSLVGALGFGWLADRIGALPALAVNAALQSLIWLSLIAGSPLSVLLLLSGAIGACLGAQVALHGAAASSMYGAAALSRVMGLSYMLKVPFMFSAAPLAGLLYDLTDGYGVAMLCSALALSIATVLFWFSRGKPVLSP